MGGMTRLLLLLWAGVTLTTALDLQKRIMGGGTCKDDERLYHVQVRAVLPNGDYRFCGGSLIHKQWILTADHCNLLGRTMKAFVKVHPGKGPGTEVKITKHVSKAEGSNVHDLMLLKLDEPVDGITPVNLPDCNKNKLKTGVEIQVAGHGPTQTGSGPSPTLRCVQIKVTETQMNDPINHERYFTGQTHGKDACHGDSGGGAVIDNTIYGVFSSGGTDFCSEPAFFMDVCEYLQWITDTMKT